MFGMFLLLNVSKNQSLIVHYCFPGTIATVVFIHCVLCPMPFPTHCTFYNSFLPKTSPHIPYPHWRADPIQTCQHTQPQVTHLLRKSTRSFPISEEMSFLHMIPFSGSNSSIHGNPNPIKSKNFELGFINSKKRESFIPPEKLKTGKYLIKTLQGPIFVPCYSREEANFFSVSH